MDDIRANYESAVFPDIDSRVPDSFAAVIYKCWNLEYQSSEEPFNDMQTAYDAFCVGDE